VIPSERRESWATSDAVRATMLGNRSRDTGPELALRRLIHAHGLRYRVAARPLPDLRRTADLVFRPARVAVFVDGCFWHSCPAHGTVPRSNPDYWIPKLARTVERDRETDRILKSAGWLPIRVWEHEAPELAASKVSRIVQRRRGN
jgi:DNA mismatch endonuclease (patch repair protein)